MVKSLAKVSKILHASEGLQEQSKQHADLLKTAAYAAEALAGGWQAGGRELTIQSSRTVGLRNWGSPSSSRCSTGGSFRVQRKRPAAFPPATGWEESSTVRCLTWLLPSGCSGETHSCSIISQQGEINQWIVTGKLECWIGPEKFCLN